MSSTTIVKPPVIPQGADITVTAPFSGPIPDGYYQGKTLVANGGSGLPASTEFNTKVVSASGANNPNDIGFVYGLYQDASYIYLCGGSMIMDGSLNVVNHCVTRYNKTTYAIQRYEFAENSAGGRSISTGVGLGVNGTQIHFFAANTGSGYSGVYFDTTTQTFTAYSTILSAFPGTAIAGTGTRTNAPGSTLFESGYNSNTITFGSYTLTGIFRFRYNNATSATPRKYVSGEGYVSNNVAQTPPLPISNTGGYIRNYERPGSSPVSVTNLSSSLNTTLGRYFLIVTYTHPAGGGNEYYNHLYELNTSTNAWINRGFVLRSDANGFQYTKVYKRASNLGIRFVVNTGSGILNSRYYNDYTYSTNSFSGRTTVSSVVGPDPGLGLTQINDGSYDTIGGYTYKPFLSVGKPYDAINNTSVVITVTL